MVRLEHAGDGGFRTDGNPLAQQLQLGVGAKFEVECFHDAGENEGIPGITLVRVDLSVLSNSKLQVGLGQTTNLFLSLAEMRVWHRLHSRVWVEEMASPVASVLRSMMRTFSGPSFASAEELSATTSAAAPGTGGLLICRSSSSPSTSCPH